MLTRFAPLAFVMLGACHPASDTASSRVLGTWVWYIALPTSDMIREDEASVPTSTAANIVAKESAHAQANDCRGTETFMADGTWVAKTTDGSEIRHPWRLIADDGNRIIVTIDMVHADRPKGSDKFITYPEWRREYVVETADILHDTIGVHDGVQFVRVRAPE